MPATLRMPMDVDKIEDSQMILSPARRGVIAAGLLLVIFIGGYSVYADLHGDGIKITYLFALMSYLAFPVYYGVLAYLAWLLIRTMINSSNYLSVIEGSLYVAGKLKGSTSRIRNVRIQRSLLNSTRIVVRFSDGSEARIKGFLLSEPADVVLERLNRVIPH